MRFLLKLKNSYRRRQNGSYIQSFFSVLFSIGSSVSNLITEINNTRQAYRNQGDTVKTTFGINQLHITQR